MNPWGMTFSQESGVQGVEDLWVVDVGYRALLFVVLLRAGVRGAGMHHRFASTDKGGEWRGSDVRRW